jgi:hypothetical protein
MRSYCTTLITACALTFKVAGNPGQRNSILTLADVFTVTYSISRDPEQSVEEQVEVEPFAQTQLWVAVAVIPLTFTPSLSAAFCMPAVSCAVVRDCAPHCKPARAALETTMAA